MEATFNATKLVKKAMVGRPGAILGYDGVVYYGYLASIKNGYAEFRYYIPGEDGEFRALVKVREKRLEMY